MNLERGSHRGIVTFAVVLIVNVLLVLGFIFIDPWVTGNITYKLRHEIEPSARFLAPYTPYSFVYGIAFVGVLAVILLLVGMIPLLRRLYFAAVLVPVGVAEFFILPHSGALYTVPPEVYTLPFIAMASGFAVPVLYGIRRFLGRKHARLMLIVLGCSEVALGAVVLFFMPLLSGGVGGDQRVFTYLDSRFLVLGVVLVTVAVYALVVGTFLYLAKSKNR